MRSCPDSPTGPFSRSPISHRLHGSPDTLPTTYKTTHRASSTVCFAIRIQFTTTCGGLFLFIPDMVRLALDQLAPEAHLPGSKMIPATHALRACLALKLWSIERKSHAMALCADEGLALFSGLNAFPKKSYLSEYSSRVHHTQTTQLLANWHDQLHGEQLFAAQSFNRSAER